MRKLAILLIFLSLFGTVHAKRELKTNTATVIMCGPFVDATDGVTPEGSMTPTNITCSLYKETHDGSVPTRTAITLAASGTDNDFALVSGSTDGMWSLELTAAQLNFTGSCRISFTDSDVMAPVWEDFVVTDTGQPSVNLIDVNGVEVEGALLSNGEVELASSEYGLIADETVAHVDANSVIPELVWEDPNAPGVKAGSDITTTVPAANFTREQKIDYIFAWIFAQNKHNRLTNEVEIYSLGGSKVLEMPTSDTGGATGTYTKNKAETVD